MDPARKGIARCARKEIRSMQIHRLPWSQHNYPAEWVGLNLAATRDVEGKEREREKDGETERERDAKKADYKAIMPETSGDANESRCYSWTQTRPSVG